MGAVIMSVVLVLLPLLFGLGFLYGLRKGSALVRLCLVSAIFWSAAEAHSLYHPDKSLKQRYKEVVLEGR